MKNDIRRALAPKPEPWTFTPSTGEIEPPVSTPKPDAVTDDTVGRAFAYETIAGLRATIAKLEAENARLKTRMEGLGVCIERQQTALATSVRDTMERCAVIARAAWMEGTPPADAIRAAKPSETGERG